MKKAQTKELWDQHRADTQAVAPSRRAQFEALWQQKEERFQTRRAEIKEQWRPIWRDTFKRQAAELRAYDDRLMVRLRHARRLQGSSVANMFRAAVNDKASRAEFVKQQEVERQILSERHKQTVRDAGREVTKAWAHDRDQLGRSHRSEDSKRRKGTKSKVDEVWKRQQAEDLEKRNPVRQREEEAKEQPRSRAARLQSFHAQAHSREEDEEATKEVRKDQRKRQRTRKRDDGGRTMEP